MLAATAATIRYACAPERTGVPSRSGGADEIERSDQMEGSYEVAPRTDGEVGTPGHGVRLYSRLFLIPKPAWEAVTDKSLAERVRFRAAWTAGCGYEIAANDLVAIAVELEKIAEEMREYNENGNHAQLVAAVRKWADRLAGRKE